MSVRMRLRLRARARARGWGWFSRRGGGEWHLTTSLCSVKRPSDAVLWLAKLTWLELGLGLG